MADSPSTATSEYEFSESQDQLIGSLARKMSLVGFVMTFFGILQVFNGVTSLFLARDPGRVIEAAKKAGVPEAQLGALSEALAGGFWSSPITLSGIAVALAGLLLFFVGWWTREAGLGFAGIAFTKGKDISRLMDALGALNRKYGLMYSILWIATILMLISLVLSLWHSWRGA